MKWVPVTDRLPRENTWVIVVLDDDNHFIPSVCLFINGKFQLNTVTIEVIYWMDTPSIPHWKDRVKL